MEVLKSGIEMDPSDLSKVKGGVCACGCDIGRDAESFSDGSVEGPGFCSCGCTGTDLAETGMTRSAAKNIPLP
jgi:hypothetical protein